MPNTVLNAPFLITPLLIGLGLAGCNSEVEYTGAFVVPSAGAITEPGAQTPFSESIAYVVGRIGGQIRPLAAESGRFLADDPTASFFRGSPLPTGRARVITSLAAYTPDPDRMLVFAADQRFGQLLEVPHVQGRDGDFPIEGMVEVSSVRSVGDGSIDELVVHDGFASTETWTLTFDGEAWTVEGSRSGKLDGRATPGEPYTPIGEPFTLTTGGDPAEGATLEFDTSTGLVEHDLSAVPVALAMAPDQSLLAISTIADDATAGGLLWWDPASAASTGQVELPDASRPGRAVWSGGSLWFTDSGMPAVWTVEAGQTTPTQIALPFRADAIAPAPEVGRIFLAVGDEIWALDADTLSLVDLDPFRPGLNGFSMHASVRGLTALPGVILQGDDDDDGVRRPARALAVSTSKDHLVFFDQALGCLFQDGLGPRTTAASTSGGAARADHNYDFDGASNGPKLRANEANGNYVSVNNCAGIARPEGWRMTFRQSLQAWEVEGTLSGVQSQLAYPDVRYVSDGGEVAFLIENGVTPAVDGWNFTFSVTDGVLKLNGDEDGDGIADANQSEVPFSLPGQPLPVTLQLEPGAAGWVAAGTPAVIVPLEGANAVSRGRPDLGIIDATWQ